MNPFSQKVQAELPLQGLWHGGRVRGLVLTGALLVTLPRAARAPALPLRQAGPVQVLGLDGHWTAARNAQVRTRPAGDGSIRIIARADGARAVRMAFAAGPGERFFG